MRSQPNSKASGVTGRGYRHATSLTHRQEVPRWHLFFVALSAWLLALSPVRAATEIEELSVFDFGTIAITGNGSVSVLEFPRSGRNLNVIGDIVVVAVGQPGRYRLTGFPPNTNIDVEIDDITLSAGGTGIPELLSVGSYDTGSVRTNELGEVEFQLGASFSTSGNGGSYEDAPYSGNAQLRFHYWEPSLSDYVTVSENVTFAGEVRSSFELTEADRLNFGVLYAVGTPDDQASLRLFPDGRRDVTNAGNARIVSLTQPTPGVVAVSGAAPFRELDITVSATDVLLRHTQAPAGPHFILNAMATLPDQSGRTDEFGALEIRVGGTLNTQITATEVVYPAGTYEGTYTITVSY